MALDVFFGSFGRSRTLAIVICTATMAAAQTQPVLTIQATSVVGRAWLTVPVEQGVWNDTTQTFRWTLSQPQDLMDQGGLVIATVRSFDIAIRHHSEYDVVFEADAGMGATTFTVSTTPVTFATVPAADSLGKARARFNVYDQN